MGLRTPPNEFYPKCHNIWMQLPTTSVSKITVSQTAVVYETTHEEHVAKYPTHRKHSVIVIIITRPISHKYIAVSYRSLYFQKSISSIFKLENKIHEV